MIARIRGTLIEKGAGRVVVDVRGVGYELAVPALVGFRLPEPGTEVTLYVRTVVREDSITLFGFDRARERDLFDRLTTVTGIGPRVAVQALSGMDADALVRAIREQDLRALSKLPGVGKKTAERMAMELKDKVADLASTLVDLSVTGLPAVAQDALSALQNLGYGLVDAQRAVDATLKDIPGEPDFQSVLAESLKRLTQG